MAAFSSALNTLEAVLRAGFFVAGIGTSPSKVLIVAQPSYNVDITQQEYMAIAVKDEARVVF
ncbi:MAG: hypothetical protein ACREOD_08710 [Candidatus Dormibacteria bacterium]